MIDILFNGDTCHLLYQFLSVKDQYNIILVTGIGSIYPYDITLRQYIKLEPKKLRYVRALRCIVKNNDDIKWLEVVLPVLPPCLTLLEITTDSKAALYAFFVGRIIYKLPSLPMDLKVLKCTNNRFISQLPPTLPPNLEELDCSGTMFDFIPKLPRSLRILNIRNMIRLIVVPLLSHNIQVFN